MMRVFFLGAGASKSIYPSLPVASELTLNYLLDTNNYPAWNTLPASEQVIANLRECCRGHEDQTLENLLGVFATDTRVIRDIHSCLKMCLAQPDTSDRTHLLNWLISVRRESSPIITTNYDTILEIGIGKVKWIEKVPGDICNPEGLVDYGVPIERVAGGGPKYEKSVKLLKLHGSINWSFCEKCRKYSFPFYMREGIEALNGISRCSSCNSNVDVEPLLVGPSKNRKYGLAINPIWEQAEELLILSVHVQNDG